MDDRWTEEMREGEVSVNGASLHVRIDGPNGAPWVVLLHALAADVTMWDSQVPALARHFRVLRFDVRGHGGSQATPGPYSMDLLVEDLRTILLQCGAKRPHLVGLSLGGMIALAAAARYPFEFASLVVMATRPDMPQVWVESWNQRVKEIRAHGTRVIAESTMARWFTPAFRSSQPELMEKVRQMIGQTSADGFAGCIDVVNNFQFFDQLSNIGVPSLFIVGEQDSASTPQVMREMQERVRNAQLVVVPDGAHLPNIEQPRAVNEALLEFLHRQPRTAELAH